MAGGASALMAAAAAGGREALDRADSCVIGALDRAPPAGVAAMVGLAGVEGLLLSSAGCGSETTEADGIPGAIVIQAVRERLESLVCHTSVLSVGL